MKTDKTRTVWKVSRRIPWSHTDAAGVPPGPAEFCWLRLSCVELQASFQSWPNAATTKSSHDAGAYRSTTNLSRSANHTDDYGGGLT